MTAPSRHPRRARYADAIEWLAQHDDNDWLDDLNCEVTLSVAASLVADLFKRRDNEIVRDLSRAHSGGSDMGSSKPDDAVPLACLFCGEPEAIWIEEIWDHDFQLDTCCEGLLEQITHDMQDDPAWGRDLMRRLRVEELAGISLRRVTAGQGSPVLLDCKLEVRDVEFRTARAFIAIHHAHCAPPSGWRFGASVFNGRTIMGIVTVGNPVARAYNGKGIIEVNRLCIRRDTDPMLRWNCCSKLYGWSAAEAERRGFTRIVTYTRDDEDGTSLRAAGWKCEGAAGGKGWHGGDRRRSNANAWVGKRWSRALRPRPLKLSGEVTAPPLSSTPGWMPPAGS